MIESKNTQKSLEMVFSSKIKRLFKGKIATIDETQYSYRIINHWENAGLLLNDRKEAKDWRRFSFEDLFWIHIIGELRTFGLSLQKIKRVKQSVFKVLINHQARPTLLELGINKLMVDKEDVSLLVHSEGESEILSTINSRMTSSKRSFILISFSQILERVFQSKTIADIYDNPELNEEEMSLLLDIRSANFDSITTHFKNGKIDRYDKTKKSGSTEKVIEQIKSILKNGAYEEIVLQLEGGKAVSFQHTSKQKVSAIGKT